MLGSGTPPQSPKVASALVSPASSENAGPSKPVSITLGQALVQGVQG